MSQEQNAVAVLPPSERAAIVLNSAALRTELTTLAESTKDITAVIDPAGRKQVHTAAMLLVKHRTGIKNNGENAREDANKFSKAVIAEQKALTAIIEPEETRLLALRDAYDEAEAKKEQDRIDAEVARMKAVSVSIANISQGVINAGAHTTTSAQIADAIIALQELNTDAEEYRGKEAEALSAKSDALVAMHTLYDARLASERAEVERLAAVAAENERLEAKRIELEAEAKRHAEARAEQDKIDAAKREAEAIEAKRIKDEQEATAKAQAARQAQLDEQQAAIDAYNARIEQERLDAIAKEKAIADAAAAQVEADRLAAEEAAKPAPAPEPEKVPELAPVHVPMSKRAVAPVVAKPSTEDVEAFRESVRNLKWTMGNDAIRSLLEASLNNDEAYFQLMAQAAA